MTVDSLDASPLDRGLANAVRLARAAAVEVGGETVGAHLAVAPDGANVASHAFESTLPGYGGWLWVVTLSRVPNGPVTVDEVVLLPGEGALLAPDWVPWHDRVRPEDLGPGDLLPAPEDDLRLVPGYVDTDDKQVVEVNRELGLGREQVLSRFGRELAAERWFDERGPESPMARQAPGRCGTCGFYLPLEGSLRAGFGVCGNEYTPADGAVVSVEYGCGAHSSVKPDGNALAERGEPVFDDGDVPL